MSLLDDVSIVVTPNGYKAGELYAVVPVPTEGAEEVNDKDFLLTGTQAENTTGTYWTTGTGWTISSGTSIVTNGAIYSRLSQSLSFDLNSTYQVTIECSQFSNGYVYLRKPRGSESDTTLRVDAVGTFKFTLQALTDIDEIALSIGVAGTNLTISSISVKEVLLASADMDVTRATAATRVDEDGLVNYAEIVGNEEVTNGDFATDTDWDKINATISGGKATITVVSGAYSLIEQSVTYQSGKTYKLTAQVQGTSGKACTFFDNGSNIGGLGISNGIINFNGSLQDVNITFTSNSNSNKLLVVRNGSGYFSFTIDNVSVKEVTRDNVPRIDYTGGGCPHILSEPQRTNLVTYSSDFTDSIWTKSSVTITPNSIISPDGSLNASLMTISGGVSDQRIYSTITYSGTNTVSIFAKASDSNWLSIRIGNSVNKWYDLENGVLGGSTITTAYVDADIQDYGNGWYRCILIFTDNFNTSTRIYPAEGNLDVTHTSGSVCIWGCQAESTSSYPTSYIPTSGSTVTRNQDIFTRDGIGSLINSTEGVLFVEMAALADDLTYREISLSDGTSTNRIEIRYTTNSNRIQVLIRNGSYLALQYDVSSIVDFNKVAFKWKTGDFALWVNGVERATDSTTFVTSGLNRLAFDQSPSGNEFFGKVKQLQVYNTALTDEQLLQLTGTSGTDFYESYAEMASALTYTIQ